MSARNTQSPEVVELSSDAEEVSDLFSLLAHHFSKREILYGGLWGAVCAKNNLT